MIWSDGNVICIIFYRTIFLCDITTYSTFFSVGCDLFRLKSRQNHSRSYLGGYANSNRSRGF